jgi:glutamate:Na+ symporter, ESS family
VLAIPVLLLGEFLVRRTRALARFDIPAPVVGGLLVSLPVLGGNVSGLLEARFQSSV